MPDSEDAMERLPAPRYKARCQRLEAELVRLRHNYGKLEAKLADSEKQNAMLKRQIEALKKGTIPQHSFLDEVA